MKKELFLDLKEEKTIPKTAKRNIPKKMMIEPFLRKKIGLLLIFIFFLLFYVIPLGIRPLVIPDEARYSEIPREMLASGDWLSPCFDGMKYFEKPSAAYWPAMLSIKIFGENNFAIRFPQALSALFSALFLFLFVRRFTGKDDLSLWTAGVFLIFGEVFLVGTFAVLDGIFSCFIAGSMCMFYYAWTEEVSVKRHLFLFVAGLLCGGAFMVKGFLGLVIPGAAIATFLVWMRDWKAFYRMSWLPLAGFLLLAGPWIVATQFCEPKFWKYFIIVEHFGRFLGDNSERHPQPFWFYVPVLLGGVMPFTVLAYSIFRGGRKLKWESPFFRFCATWVVVPLILLSISSGKLGTYILPLFPAIAAIVTFAMFQSFKDARTKSFNLTANILAIAFGIAAVIFLIIQLTGIQAICLYRNGESGKFLLALLGIVFFSVAMRYSAKAENFKRKMFSFCIAPLPLMLCWHLTFPNFIAHKKAPGEFIAECSEKINPEDTVVAYNDIAGLACWILKRNDFVIYRRAGEFEYGISKAGGQKRLFNVDEFKKFIQEKSKDKRVDIFLPQRYVKRYLKDLNPLEEKSNGEYSMLIF